MKQLVKMTRYVIETKNGKYLKVEQRDSYSLYIWESSNPLDESCQFKTINDVVEFLQSMEDHVKPYKGWRLFGYMTGAVDPLVVKQLNLRYELEEVK